MNAGLVNLDRTEEGLIISISELVWAQTIPTPNANIRGAPLRYKWIENHRGGSCYEGGSRYSIHKSSTPQECFDVGQALQKKETPLAPDWLLRTTDSPQPQIREWKLAGSHCLWVHTHRGGNWCKTCCMNSQKWCTTAIIVSQTQPPYTANVIGGNSIIKISILMECTKPWECFQYSSLSGYRLFWQWWRKGSKTWSMVSTFGYPFNYSRMMRWMCMKPKYIRVHARRRWRLHGREF